MHFDVLGEVVAVSEFGDHNYVFNIYSQTDAIYEQQKADALLENAAENCVDISMISNNEKKLDGFQGTLLTQSNGISVNSFDDISDAVYRHVFDDYVPEGAISALLITGYEWIELDGILNEYNGIDTDHVECEEDHEYCFINDHLTDWEEIGVNHWKKRI